MEFPKSIKVVSAFVFFCFKLKSHRYWPKSGKETHEGITVELLTETTNNGYITREFTVSNQSVTFPITQYHYLAWPDHGVPTENKTLMSIMRSAEIILGNTLEKRIVVHCR